MVGTNFSRKIDSAGRIVIPSKLRDQTRLEIGKEYEFYLTEENNHLYICIDCGPMSRIYDMETINKVLASQGLKAVQKDPWLLVN